MVCGGNGKRWARRGFAATMLIRIDDDGWRRSIASRRDGQARFSPGSMGELGESSDEWHRRVGASINLMNNDIAVIIGDGAAALKQGFEDAGHSGRVELISSVDEAQQYLSGFYGDVFIKGSRRYGLESAVRFLERSSETVKTTC